MALTSKQRAYLRSLANTMDPIVQIGKESITPNLVKQTWDALEARELIKVQLLKNAPYETREACDTLCEQVHADPVQCVGYRFVLYRHARKDSKINFDQMN